MLGLLTTAAAMGLGTGLSCMVFCVPLIVPYTGTAAQPSWSSGLVSATLFSAGRLISYAALLIIIASINSLLPANRLVEAVATLITGVLAVFSALVVFGVTFPRPGRCFCRAISGHKPPFYWGMLAGFRPCAPLLAALAYTLTLKTPLNMSLFLLSFWLMTSLPIMLIGLASGKIFNLFEQRIGLARVRRISGIAMMVVGLVLVVQAIGLFSA